MSNALAIAGVTAVIRDLLDSGMIDHQVTDAMGKGVTVSATAPDNIELTGANATPRVNLFLHQVTANPAWRNVGFPSHDARGNRTDNPPLALDLHYLLTSYGNEDLQAEVLLGYAMQLLHETPVLARDAIRKALNPLPVNGNVPVNGRILPSVYQALRTADLAEQVEQIKITPASLNTEEMSQLWSALQARYRPTAAYKVSVVLIESSRPARSALPVLSRGKIDPATLRERGVIVEPGLVPAVPMIESVVPPGGQPAARLGETINLTGHHLDGAGRMVLLTNDRFEIEERIPVMATGGAALIQFSIPSAQAADFPAGVWRVGARMLRPDESRPGETIPCETNRLAMTLAPEITGLPMGVARDGAGAASFTINFRPALRAGQPVVLVLGQREFQPEPFAPAATSLNFVIEDAPVGKHLARLRIDGIESPIIDRSPLPDKPPVFFDHRITIT